MQKSKINSLAAAMATLAAFGSFVGQVNAALVPTRPALQALLGGPGTLEDFEAFSISAGTANTAANGSLNSASIVNGQGPGLVVPGVDFILSGGSLQWNGAAYYGSPSQEILANSQPLVIDFTSSVNAFGVDLRAYAGYGTIATMDIYALDDTTLIGTVGLIPLSSSGVPLFVGWEDAGGIGSIVLTQSGELWSPIIDNLEFGLAAVPEPSTYLAGALLALVFGVQGVRSLRSRKQA